MEEQQTAFERAVDLVGGQTEMASRLGVRQGQIWAWLKRNKSPLPTKHCPKVEADTGVTCEELRPDVKWVRNKAGKVTHYMTPVPAANSPQAKAAA